jgi:hypothetical protein
MEKHRFPRIGWKYQPKGRRNPGRPRIQGILRWNRQWGLNNADDGRKY